MIHCLITVRSTSTRLPGKCFLPFGEMGVLEHVVRRTQHYGLTPVICTTHESADDPIVTLANDTGVECFRGPVLNKLQRWRDCCRNLGIEEFHSVDADDPFFCGDEVRRSFALMRSGYDMVSPTVSSSGGGATVGYSIRRDIIEQACEGLSEDTDTEMMWSYVERLPDIKKTILDEPAQDIIRARMTLDYPEDYIFLEALRLILGNMATRAQIAETLKNNPDLELINAFRNEEWAKNQRMRSLQT